ncbi:hypothetical protein DEO72_LG2g3776 [Vigna unguiculata]|uniref:Uncharacterized protein n=1 Tax=Vigna unguiculata TaxID=3917 RepID=A0A4D6L4H6_VIGUN|nr:hypothetical protein DEO72_LG2g3776 [Vigna unguiculata]
MSSSDSISLSTSSSNESTKLERSRGRQFDEEGTSSGGMTSGIPMETVREVREDPPEELAESNWLAKGDYGWAAADVRNQSSLFRWSHLLNSWLNCTPVISKGVSGDIISLERVSAIDRTPSVGYLAILDKSPQYLQTRYGSTKFPFSWTCNPSRYKDMGMDELSAGDKEVVEILLKFVDKVPTKGLVRVYNSVHPIIDIEGHMAQSGKKNLALFQSLRKEMAAKAKAAGKTDVPNLQESVVEVHVHDGTKRKAELPPRHGKGKDVKRVRAALLGTGSASGAGSASGEKGPESRRWSSLEARP